MPKRIQRQRTKGWRMPEGAVYVGRRSNWGNPWPVERVARGLVSSFDWSGNSSHPLWYSFFCVPGAIQRRETRPEFGDVAWRTSVEMFRACAEHFRDTDAAGFEVWVAPLRGRDLCCWCPLDQPCHADVLLELANRDG